MKCAITLLAFITSLSVQAAITIGAYDVMHIGVLGGEPGDGP